MDFLQRLFGRDIFNLICDYANPITDLAMERREHMHKAFLMCSNYIDFTTIHYNRWNYLFILNNISLYTQAYLKRHQWIKHLRGADIFLSDGNTIKLRSRNKDISYEYICTIYNLGGSIGNEIFYKHGYYKDLKHYPHTNKMYPTTYF